MFTELSSNFIEQVGTRISAILKPQRGGWLRSTIALVIIGLLCLSGLSQQGRTQQAEAQEQPLETAVAADNEDDKYFIFGRVTDAAKRAAWLQGEPISWDKSPPQAFGFLDANGRGEVTQVGASGALVVGIVNVLGEIVANPLFENTQVVSAEKVAGTSKTKLVDSNGRMAVVTEATISLEDGVPLLRYQLKSTAPVAIQKLTGRVVTENDLLMANARLPLAMGSDGGSAVQPPSAMTDADGNFQLEFPIASRFTEDDNSLKITVFINKHGFAAIDMPFIDASEGFTEIDFGKIQLAKGYNLPVAAVDAAENTIATIHLAELVTAVSAASADTAVKPANPMQRAEPPQAGTAAPELLVKSWSDGQQRSLGDYRDKVVVLDFWGLWCGPCINAIPTMKTLAEKYEPQGFVFLGIHTADGDTPQINKLKKSMAWNTTSAIDNGTSITDSKTAAAYGVSGFPGIVIIDTEGKIAFHSGIMPKDMKAFMSGMERIAKDNGIAWPLPQDLPENEMKRISNVLMTAQFSAELERILDSEQ